MKTRDLEKKNLEFQNLKLKFGKILSRLSSSIEKINSLEKANSSLKEENQRLNRDLIYENKLKGGFFLIKSLNFLIFC